jgi:hypothetical protein
LRRFALPFLLNYTNPETQTLRDKFGCSIPETTITPGAVMPLTGESAAEVEGIYSHCSIKVLVFVA